MQEAALQFAAFVQRDGTCVGVCAWLQACAAGREQAPDQGVSRPQHGEQKSVCLRGMCGALHLLYGKENREEHLKGTELQEGMDCWLPESHHAPATPCMIGPPVASFADGPICASAVKPRYRRPCDPLHTSTDARDSELVWLFQCIL
jgi:hypothetical protein